MLSQRKCGVKIRTINPNGMFSLVLQTKNSKGKWSYGDIIYPQCSYAWICSKEYWDKNEYIDDCFRFVSDDFKGANTMEGHFEFHMTPEELKIYLLSLGMTEVSFS